MRILQEENWFYTAWVDEKDEYFLEAVCGTVAIFTITVKLTAEEIAAYHKNHESLRMLAQSIVDRPDDFLHRRV